MPSRTNSCIAQVLQQLVAQGSVVHQVGAQAHARDRRLQVVRDRRQDLHAFGQVDLDAVLDGVEGARRLRHFARPVFAERRGRHAGAQRVGRLASRCSGRVASRTANHAAAASARAAAPTARGSQATPAPAAPAGAWRHRRAIGQRKASWKPASCPAPPFTW
jgi:hypothetical protein